MRLPFATVSKLLRDLLLASRDLEQVKLLAGQVRVHQVLSAGPYSELRQAEVQVFSQFGDDGIIQFLITHLGPLPDVFIEFGVEDYREANTRFLLLNNNWRGTILDGSEGNIRRIEADYQHWRHALQARQAFVTRENIDAVLVAAGLSGEVGLLSIDIDGNDYWVWEAIESVRPAIVIVEYNSVFGPERAVTVPYRAGFTRLGAHWSGLYYGASLAALAALGGRKGYALVGCNSAGNNAYFVRTEFLRDPLRALSPAEAFVDARFRESRDPAGRLTYLDGPRRLDPIRGQEVWDVLAERLVALD